MEEPTPLVQRRQRKRKNDGLIGSKILGEYEYKNNVPLPWFKWVIFAYDKL